MTYSHTADELCERIRRALHHASKIEDDVRAAMTERENSAANANEMLQTVHSHVHDVCGMLGVNTEETIGDSWALRAAAADVMGRLEAAKARAARLREELHERVVLSIVDTGSWYCSLCRQTWRDHAPENEQHAPDCLAAPVKP